jgi:outer membrane protein OmpA-like peptidoglycan-associated protein
MIHRARQGAAALCRASRPAVLLAVALTTPAAALDLALPEGASIAAATPPGAGTHVIATGTWDGSRVPLRTISGTVRSATWQIPAGEDISLAAVTAGIERQLREQGYRIDLTCADRACGGFDFRQQLDMGQSPEMHVDIGNFRYLAASVETEGEAVAVTVSFGGQTLYVHVVHIGETAENGTWVTPSSRAPVAPDPSDDTGTIAEVPTSQAIARLAESGSVPLDDLRFRTGASELSGSDYPSLVALAAFLAENPARRVVLVGHTDAEGGRESNIALSEARAEAVRRHLVNTLGVNPAQLDAAGIGYLAPRATNETAGGREANRRVEVVLLDAG